MNEVFVCSDPHIGHLKCMTEWRGFSSLDEGNEFVIDKINSKVKSHNNTLYILGDAVFNPTVYLPLLHRLIGNKFLIMGNHDSNAHKYLPYFTKIMSVHVYSKRYVMTHIPIHPYSFEHRWEDCINLHGHIHGAEKFNLLKNPRYFNVNLEMHNYEPISITKELPDLITAYCRSLK